MSNINHILKRLKRFAWLTECNKHTPCRQIRYSISDANPNIDEFMDEKLAYNDQQSKERLIKYQDNQVGDRVLVEEKK